MDAVGDTVVENASEGIDLVVSSVSFTLASNVENLTLTGFAANSGTGNTLDNTIVGNDGNNALFGGTAGNDTLDGGAGNDTLTGGAGNDTYIVDSTSDAVIESSGEGTDSVLASSTFTLAANVENLTLTGSAAIDGTGNDLANTLIGNTAANTLSGWGGNYTISGGSGNDMLDGGIGNDSRAVAGIAGHRDKAEIRRIEIRLAHRRVERIGCSGTGGCCCPGKRIVDPAQSDRIERADLDPALAHGPVGKHVERRVQAGNEGVDPRDDAIQHRLDPADQPIRCLEREIADSGGQGGPDRLHGIKCPLKHAGCRVAEAHDGNQCALHGVCHGGGDPGRAGAETGDNSIDSKPDPVPDFTGEIGQKAQRRSETASALHQLGKLIDQFPGPDDQGPDTSSDQRSFQHGQGK